MQKWSIDVLFSLKSILVLIFCLFLVACGRQHIFRDGDPALFEVKDQSRQALASGSIRDFSEARISLGEGADESLGEVAKRIFKSQQDFADELAGMVGKAILAAPEIQNEVREYDNSYMLRQKTAIVVTDPHLLRQHSREYRKFMANQPKTRIKVSSLGEVSRSGLEEFRSNYVKRLDSQDPLRKAANLGEQELLNAVFDGKGKFAIEDTVIIPKSPPEKVNGKAAFPILDKRLLDHDSCSVVTRNVARIQTEERSPSTIVAVQNRNSRGDQSSSPNLSNKDVGKGVRIRANRNGYTNQGGTGKKVQSVAYREDNTRHHYFLSGFTQGHGWEWERRWLFTSGYFSATMGAGCGIGLRIPVRVDVRLVPKKLVWTTGREKFELLNSITVTALDAERSFYDTVGLPKSQEFGGKELVLEMKTGFGFKGRALWMDIGSLPFKTYGEDHSEHFQPPFGKQKQGVVVEIPTSLTRSSINVGMLKGAVKAGLRFTGDGGVKFNYSPKIGDTTGSAKHLEFTGPYINVGHIITPAKDINKNHGYELDFIGYNADLTIAPTMRVEVDANVFNFSRSFMTDWWDLNEFKLKAGTLVLGVHEGTRWKDEYTGDRLQME